MVRKITIAAASVAVLALAAIAFAQQQSQFGTAEEAKAMLTTRKKEGSWKATSICFACRPVTAKIVALANQNAKQLIGTDQRALKDSTAKEYGKELFAAVQKPKDNSQKSNTCFQNRARTRRQLRR